MASVQTDPGEANGLVRNGLILGAVGHGVSNTLLLAQRADGALFFSPILAIVFAIILYRQVAKNIATSLAISPFQVTARRGDLHGPDSTRT
jgi:phosphate/sulfate permease